MKDFSGPLGDQMLVINENTEAQLIAIQFELAEGLATCPQKGPFTLHSLYREHPTHWVVVGRGWNHPDPKENGWIAMFIPKKHETEAQVRKHFGMPPLKKKTP
jgi:hypothetical protein